MFEAFFQAIKSHETIVIHRHNRPDGDALGSQIGLKYLLLENFPEKTIYAVGDGAGYLSFMEKSEMDEIPDEVFRDALSVILDTSSPALISDERYKLAKATARIDHHIFQGKIAEVEVIDDSFESCCGLITQFAMECGLQLNTIAAKSLYTGMLTDSGRFRYDGTTARTFRLAAFLRDQPFQPSEIFRELYAESFEDKKKKAQFILRTQFTENKVAYIYTDKADLQELGLDTFTASRGMVNVMADLKGVGIWANFTEIDEGVVCELRSAELNINPVAVKYGGGGHAKACGATVPDRETAMALLGDLDQMLGEMK